MSRAGHPETLVAAHPSNTNRLTAAHYSPRILSERAAAVADAIMEAPHTVLLDRVAAEELASLVALCERLDVALESRPLDHPTAQPARPAAQGVGPARAVAHEVRPHAARAEWAAKLAGQAGLAAEIRRRLDGAWRSSRSRRRWRAGARRRSSLGTRTF